MRTSAVVVVVGVYFAYAVMAWSGKLKNASFEENFGPSESQSAWGDFGDIFGEARQVYDGKDPVPLAHSGRRVLAIDVPPNTWNGIWQQLSYGEGASYTMVGYCQIRGGDLPPGCATFLKVEFYDGNDQLIEYVEGEHLKKDTKGNWVKTVLNGKTPPGTRAIRFVVIAGDNAGNEKVSSRIFWDDVDVLQ